MYYLNTIQRLLIVLFLMSHIAYAEQEQKIPTRDALKLPPVNPKVHECVRAAFDYMNVKYNPQEGANAEEEFRRMGKLIDAKNSAGLSDIQFAEQLFLTSFENVDGQGGLEQLSLAILSSLANTPSSDSWMEAVAPYLEVTDKDRIVVRQYAEHTLRMTRVLFPRGLANESDRSIYPLDSLLNYLKKHRVEDHPNLISICLLQEPAATFNTLIALVKDRSEQQELRVKMMEIQLLIDTLELALVSQKDASDPKIVEAQSKLKSKCRELAESPQWCMRAFVVAKYSHAFHDNDLSLIEKLSKDNHPVVARLAKSLLPERSSGAASNP